MSDLTEYRERVVEALERACLGIAGDYDRSGEEIVANILLAPGGVVAEIVRECDHWRMVAEQRGETMNAALEKAQQNLEGWMDAKRDAAEVRARVEALCNAAERHADTYKRACIVTTGQVWDALADTRPIPPLLTREAPMPENQPSSAGGDALSPQALDALLAERGWSESERECAVSALHAARYDSAGHWPTVAGWLLAVVDTLAIERPIPPGKSDTSVERDA